MYTAAGEAHGLINTLSNAVVYDDFKHMTPANKEKLLKEKKEDARIVKAEYLNKNGRHERLTKPYCRYAGDPINIWHLIPGRVYELPMGFIKEVNSVKMPVRSGLMEVDGDKVTKDGSPLEKDDMDGNWIHKLIPVSF